MPTTNRAGFSTVPTLRALCGQIVDAYKRRDELLKATAHKPSAMIKKFCGENAWMRGSIRERKRDTDIAAAFALHLVYALSCFSSRSARTNLRRNCAAVCWYLQPKC
jgi:hypothetical protein